MKLALVRALGLLPLLLAVSGRVESGPSAQSGQVCSLLEVGLRQFEARDLNKALINFEAAKTCASLEVKAEAFLRIGEIKLVQVPADITAAEQNAQIVLQQFPNTPAAAGAHVLKGRIMLAGPRSKANIDGVLEEFERATVVVMPGSNGEGNLRSSEAAFFAGEALRLGRRHEEALAKYREAALKFPESIWAARGLLGVAQCYVRAGKPELAMDALQQVRLRFVNFPTEAATALNWNTILYRLHVRPRSVTPIQSSNTLGDDSSKLRGGIGVAIDPIGRVVVAHLDGWSIFTGTAESAVPRDKRVNEDYPTAIGFATEGGVAIATSSFIRVYRPDDTGAWKAPRAFFPVMATRTAKLPLKPLALIATWQRQWLVADQETKAIQRLSSDFTYSGLFATFPAGRLAINDIDDVAALDRDKRLITVFGRDGLPLRQDLGTDRKGPDGQTWQPIDLAFDALANLYVLDRAAGAVHVFDPAMKFIRTFRFATEGDLAVRPAALAVDAAGRFVVFDDKTDKVRIFQ